MSKQDNLHDFLTDIADAVREKKGTTDPINAQNLSEEIKSISTSMWTGHVDVEGLKAIGWDDDDIAYYQKYGVNWMEEDDEYHKVSEDNKALYGVLTADNYKEYKDSIVYMPKISGTFSMYEAFMNFTNLVAVPMIEPFSTNGPNYRTFESCCRLKCVHIANGVRATRCKLTFNNCYSLQHVPEIITAYSKDFDSFLKNCYSITEINDLDVSSATNVGSFIANCVSLKKVNNIIDVKGLNAYYLAIGCYSLVHIKIKNLSSNIRFNSSAVLSKQSILYMINNEDSESPITIELRSEVYNSMSVDPDVVEALSNHPLVTLAIS